MKALMVILLVLAVFALAAAAAYGTVMLTYRVLEAVRGFVCHEMVMRPRERYYRMGGTW